MAFATAAATTIVNQRKLEHPYATTFILKKGKSRTNHFKSMFQLSVVHYTATATTTTMTTKTMCSHSPIKPQVLSGCAAGFHGEYDLAFGSRGGTRLVLGNCQRIHDNTWILCPLLVRGERNERVLPLYQSDSQPRRQPRCYGFARSP